MFALRDRGADCFLLAVKPCTLPLHLPFGQRSGSLLFFIALRDSTLPSLANKHKLTGFSVHCVVSMPYRSVRKKKERNRKYFAYNSEQLKARGVSLYEEDPGKKKAAVQAYYDVHREERKASFSSYYDAYREERKASFSSYYDANKGERKASTSSYYDAHREERKASFSCYYDAHEEER